MKFIESILRCKKFKSTLQSPIDNLPQNEIMICKILCNSIFIFPLLVVVEDLFWVFGFDDAFLLKCTNYYAQQNRHHRGPQMLFWTLLATNLKIKCSVTVRSNWFFMNFMLKQRIYIGLFNVVIRWDGSLYGWKHEVK